MAFYIMKQDTSIEDSAILGSVPDDLTTVLKSDKVELILSENSGDYRGDIISGYLTLYHQDLKNVLDELGVESINYIPVRLKDFHTGETEGGFFVVEGLPVLDCVDMEKSKTKAWATGIGFDFLSMAIDSQKTQGHKIFRLKDDPTKIIINQELYDYFEQADNLVGVELVKTEDYSDW